MGSRRLWGFAAATAASGLVLGLGIHFFNPDWFQPPQPGTSPNIISQPGIDPPYDVFLSHAGEEKSPVVSHLYNSLVARGLRVFVDYRDLPNDHPGEPNSDVMVGAAKTARVGLFVVSEKFLQKKWPLKELGIFLDRKRDPSDSEVRILPVFYWNGFAEDSFKLIPWSKRQVAKKQFDELSNYVGAERYPGEMDAELMEKIADMASKAVAKLDVDRAVRLGKLSEGATTISNFEATTSKGDDDTEGISTAYKTITTNFKNQPHRVLRHVLVGTSLMSTAGLRIGRGVVDAGDPVPSIAWRLDGSNESTICDGLVTLGRKMGITSINHLTSVNREKLGAIRVIRTLQEWSLPWLIVVESVHELRELERHLPFVDADVPAKSAGLVLAASDRLKFDTKYYWPTHEVTIPAPLSTSAVDPKHTISKELTDLSAFFASPSVKDSIEELIKAFGLSDDKNYADQAARLDKWAETIRRLNNNLPVHAAEARRANELNNHRRLWLDLFRRFQILKVVYNVLAETMDKLEFPGMSRIIKFLQVCEPMDEANYRIVINGKNWEQHRPRIYQFVRDFAKELKRFDRLENENVAEPLKFGQLANKKFNEPLKEQ